MTKARNLILFNGPVLDCQNISDPRWKDLSTAGGARAYVAAYSRADAKRVIELYCGEGRGPSDERMKKHWTQGHWGLQMEGVTPERGLWIVFSRGAEAVRVV